MAGIGLLAITRTYFEVLDSVREEFVSTHDEQGGADGISGGSGKDLIIAGPDGDTASGNAGDDVIVGDNGRIPVSGLAPLSIETQSLEIGGSDTLFGDTGNDIIFGGHSGDVVNGGVSGDDVLLGDNGIVHRWDGTDKANDVLSTGFVSGGGDDLIVDSDGLNLIIGGRGDDGIDAGSGRDYIAGDFADVTRDAGDVIELMTSEVPAPSIGGADTILARSGALNVVIGGFGPDTISGAGGNEFVLGDNGVVEFDSTNGQSVARRMRSTNPDIGGDDLIITDNATDYIIAGAANDAVGAGADAARDVVLGDHGVMTFGSTGRLLRIDATDYAIGGRGLDLHAGWLRHRHGRARRRRGFCWAGRRTRSRF